MVYDANTSRRYGETSQRAPDARADAPASTGIPFWDMMLSFGKASQQALAGYGAASDQAPRSDHGAHHVVGDVEVIPIGEETLNVGTHMVAGATTRIRRVVVETPVERAVSLREERVIVERRKPTAATAATTQGLLTETAVEMSDSFEVIDVWKSVRVTEEVVLRREVTERTETVRDIVRRDEVVVEQPRRTLPAARPEADLKKAAERVAADVHSHDKAPAPSRPQPELQKAASAEPPKGAETPKLGVPSTSPQASAEQNDKGNSGRKS